MKKLGAILLACCLLATMTGCQNTTPDESAPTTATTTTTTVDSRPLLLQIANAQLTTYYDTVTGRTRYYYLCLPVDYSPEKTYPVMLYLHGAGERGAATIEPLQNMFYSLYGDMKDYFQQTIVIVPQCPTNGWWSLDTDQAGVHRGELGTAMRLLDKTCTDYSADRNRIYVMGLSMGGFGTWEALAHFPQTFAAGIPICGWSNVEYASVLANIPIWAYHGLNDPTVSYQGSQEMVDAIRSAGGNRIHITLHPTATHGVWIYTAQDRALFDWLFSQRKQG